jgi:MFS family permease
MNRSERRANVALMEKGAEAGDFRLPLAEDLVCDAAFAELIFDLAMLGCLITAGRLGDMPGRRRLLLVGTVVFGAASVLAALAGNGGILIMARLLQGLGGAMILPATLSTVNAMFTGRERGIAFAIWGSTIGGWPPLVRWPAAGLQQR